MAERISFLILILKKFQGVPFTNVSSDPANESIGNSNSRVVADFIFNQTIPKKAPFSYYDLNNTIRSDVINNILDSPTYSTKIGEKYISVDEQYNYIVYYSNILLDSDNIVPRKSFYFAGTNPENISNPMDLSIRDQFTKILNFIDFNN
jgi:hypothetical protein